MSNQLVKYEAGGTEITLTVPMVQQFITKGNTDVTETEAINFMMLCKGAGLNPFLNEAYLIKYGNQTAQMITSKEAILKRASRQKNYQGMENGIVVATKDGNVKHKKGTLLYPGEELIGAWAQVHREDFKEPVYAEVAFAEYTTGKATWKNMPTTMINKVAQNKALREAYPDELGAMYSEEETGIIAEVNDVTPKDNNGDPVEFVHSKEIEEPTETPKEAIARMRKEAKEAGGYKTLKAVDDDVVDLLGVEDINFPKDEFIIGALSTIIRRNKTIEAETNEG